MNIIQEQREDIIKNNNTAQKHLQDILETLSVSATILSIREPLHGDLDFSPLSGRFSLIKTILLPEGEITSIANIPNGIEVFQCSKNMLFSIENLPGSLLTLNISYNYLTSIDVSTLENLKIMNVSHNEIQRVENLPKTLEEVYCDFNKIEYIDLQGLEVLQKLNVSNNRVTIIENLPENIIEFSMENTPSIEFRNSAGEIPITSTREIGRQTEQREKTDYIESLNAYFRLKTKYENKLYDDRKKVYNKVYNKESKTSNKRIAQKKASEVKAKCIHCKRAVGTIFTRKNSRYIALCGDTLNPCKLNIEIYNGFISNIYDMLDLFKEDMEDIKNTIICQKLDTLFNYVTEEESIKLFKKELKLYNENSMIFKEILDEYNSLYNNKEKQEKVAMKNEKLYRNIESSRQLINEYKTTGNDEFLKTAVQIYVKEMIPEIRSIRLLKHEVMELNMLNKTNNENTLFTYPVNLSKLDFNNGEPERVIKFIS